MDGKPMFGETFGPRRKDIIVRWVPADPATFAIVSPPARATPRAWTYARDSKRVFLGAPTGAFVLADCDPATFVILSSDGKFSRDSNHVYYCGLPLKGADPKTFQILEPPFSKDSTHAYAGAASIDVLDAATFEVVQPGDSAFPLLCNGPHIQPKDLTTSPTSIWGWARDSKAYYRADSRVKGADWATFEVLNLFYAKDKDRVYCCMDRKVVPVADADAATFQVSPTHAAGGQDRNYEFSHGKKVDQKNGR